MRPLLHPAEALIRNGLVHSNSSRLAIIAASISRITSSGLYETKGRAPSTHLSLRTNELRGGFVIFAAISGGFGSFSQPVRVSPQCHCHRFVSNGIGEIAHGRRSKPATLWVEHTTPQRPFSDLNKTILRTEGRRRSRPERQAKEVVKAFRLTEASRCSRLIERGDQRLSAADIVTFESPGRVGQNIELVFADHTGRGFDLNAIIIVIQP